MKLWQWATVTVLLLALIVLSRSWQNHVAAMYMPAMPGIPGFEDAEKVCTVRDSKITESSGLAISRRFSDCVWTHNDSGDSPRLFLLDMKGRTRLIVNVKADQAYDWEDMCSFERDGKFWLLIADTGDNGKVRTGRSNPCRLLLLEEPIHDLPKNGDAVSVTVDVQSEIQFTYPGGARDCESVAVDAGQGDILLISKADPTSAMLYRLKLPTESAKQSVTAEEVCPLGVAWATAMDVSSDGRWMVIVNPLSGIMIERDPQETWASASKKMVRYLTLPKRAQGETVCFTRDGKDYLLGSEGQKQPLWKMPLPPPISSDLNAESP